jgi:phenylalanine-4-hydroxylase
MARQDYNAYTTEDFAVWKLLFERQMKNLPERASLEFLSGLDKIQFNAERIPNFAETTPLLQACTGWSLTEVPGIVDDALFFRMLSERKFPATTWLRKMKELDYLEEPDMFHDVFAHVPLLSNQAFVNFLEELSKLALEHIENAWAIELISRIYWFTVEFGLIQEEEGLRIYGAGILSSAGETFYCLGEQPERRPYEVGAVLDTPYRKDTFQTIYYVIGSYEQLYGSLPLIRQELNKRLELDSKKVYSM